MTIIDEIAYSGLTPGKTYTISGILMDKATGEPLLIDARKSPPRWSSPPNPQMALWS